MRRITSAEGGHRSGHRFIVSAFEGGHYFVLFLFGVEIFGQIIDPFAVHGSHGMPKLNFCLRLRCYAA